MKKYDYDFKISVVEAYKNGLNYKEIREKFHVTKTCFYDWLKLYNTKVHQKEKTFTYKQYEELQKKFEKISRELEIIKLSHCFADSPRKQKEEAIERLVDKFPVKEMCRVLDLPVGTFYNYHLRRVDTTQNQIRDEYLKEEIIKIFNTQCFSRRKYHRFAFRNQNPYIRPIPQTQTASPQILRSGKRCADKSRRKRPLSERSTQSRCFH